jgi:hypothetical protein
MKKGVYAFEHLLRRCQTYIPIKTLLSLGSRHSNSVDLNGQRRSLLRSTHGWFVITYWCCGRRRNKNNPDVRFGSQADICAAISDVRFTPKSDRKTPNSDLKSRHAANGHVCFPPESGHFIVFDECPTHLGAARLFIRGCRSVLNAFLQQRRPPELL